MVNNNLKPLKMDRRELTYDLYPDDKRFKNTGPPINFQQVFNSMGCDSNRIEYDVDPGTRKRL